MDKSINSLEYIQFKNMFTKNKEYKIIENDNKTLSKENILLFTKITAMKDIFPTNLDKSKLQEFMKSNEGAGEKIADFFKKIWEGIKAAFRKIIELIKKFWSWLIGIFKKKVETFSKLTYEEIYSMNEEELKQYKVKCKNWKNLGNLNQNITNYIDTISKIVDSLVTISLERKNISKLYEISNEIISRLESLGIFIKDSSSNQYNYEEIMNNNEINNPDTLLRLSNSLFYENGQIEEIEVTANEILTKANIEYMKTDVSKNTKYLQVKILAQLQTSEKVLKQMQEDEKRDFENYINKGQDSVYFEEYSELDSKYKLDKDHRFKYNISNHNLYIERYKLLLFFNNLLFNCSNVICKHITEQTSDLYEVSRQIIRYNK